MILQPGSNELSTHHSICKALLKPVPVARGELGRGGCSPAPQVPPAPPQPGLPCSLWEEPHRSSPVSPGHLGQGRAGCAHPGSLLTPPISSSALPRSVPLPRPVSRLWLLQDLSWHGQRQQAVTAGTPDPWCWPRGRWAQRGLQALPTESPTPEPHAAEGWVELAVAVYHLQNKSGLHTV